MKKVLFVATVVKTHIMTFHIPYLKMLKEMGYETTVAARNDYEDPKDCIIPYCDNYYDIPFERSPYKPSNIKAYKALKKVIDEGEYDIIHCHTPVGAMLTRLAALVARKHGTKVIYTAHGFHFFKGAPLINWLLYFPVEWFLAHFTDALITINKEDYACAQKFAARKVYYVPGVGIDTKKFAVDPETKRVKREALRAELGIPDDAIVLLSVGEVNENKNHRVVVEALSKLEGKNIHYIICGCGELEESHEDLAKQLGLDRRVHLTGYRNDVVDFYQAADIFVFPSFREGLPVAVMEAMASGLPVICSLIRGNTDLVIDTKNGHNGVLCKADDVLQFADAIRSLCESRVLRQKYVSASVMVSKKFSIENVAKCMKNIYIDSIR